MIYSPKTPKAPECLAIEKAKKSGDYNCGDVLQRIQTDFNNKCYICEFKNPPTINTEHFKAHKGNIDKKFNWNNLFYVCAHCNNIKLAKDEFEDILDCTTDKDIDKKIKYEIKALPKEKAIITAVVQNNTTVANTVTLLNAVYNGSTVLKTLEAANIRKELLSEIRKFNDLLFEFDDDLYNDEEKEVVKQKIIRQLRSVSPFTAFKRWVIRGHEVFRDEFAEQVA